MSESDAAGRRQTTAATGHDSWSTGENAVRRRIARGVLVPELQPGFRLTPRARVFVIGPWFARQLETALLRSGAQVTSVLRGSPVVEIARNTQLGLLNKYSPASIQQELDWAAETELFPAEGLLPSGDAWYDPHLDFRAPQGPMEALLARRRAVSAYFSRAFAADLVVLVLGRTETWFDRRTRLAITGAPLVRLYKAEPDRFGLRRLSHDDVLAHLKAICALLRQRAPKQKILLAVSPIPIERTWGKEDVIVANMAAKSTLHTVAMTMAQANAHIDYFPAYEAAAMSDPGRTWQADRRSLKAEIMQAITRALVDGYGLHLAEDSETAGQA